MMDKDRARGRGSRESFLLSKAETRLLPNLPSPLERFVRTKKTWLLLVCVEHYPSSRPSPRLLASVLSFRQASLPATLFTHPRLLFDITGSSKMLPITLRSALLFPAAFLPAPVLGDDVDGVETVTFAFADCALTCVQLVGYSTNSKGDQELMCEDSSEGLLQAVELCMTVACSDSLSNVDADLITPMQAGCQELDRPVSDVEIAEAQAAALRLTIVSVGPTSTPSSSIDTPAAANPTQRPTTLTATPTGAPTVQTQGQTTSEVRPSAAQEASAPPVAQSSTSSALSVLETETSAQVIQAVTESATTSSTQSAPELGPTVAPSAFSSSTTTTMQRAPSSISTTSQEVSAPQPTPQSSATRPVTQSEATSTSAQDHEATPAAAGAQHVATSQASTSDRQPAAASTTSRSPDSGLESDAGSGRHSTATSTGDEGLVVATGEPTGTYSSALFGVATSTSTSSVSSPTSSEESDGIGGGSPFSTSAASATARGFGTLAACWVAVAIFASAWL